LKPDDLDTVVMVGGATRMPIVRSLVARLFGRLPLVHIDPDRTVALGAAVQAGLKGRAAALEDVVMTDVCPYTLGVAAVDSIETADRKYVSWAFFLFPVWAIVRRLYVRAAIALAAWIAIPLQL